MAINYPEILGLKSEGRPYSWSERDTILYALGLGLGFDPLDPAELPFIYERGLKALPTLATVVAWGADMTDRMALNYGMLVDGEQAVELHQPMPVRADITADSRVVRILDKGPKGAVVTTEIVLKEAHTGAPIATLTSSIFARGDGGFGGPSGGAPDPHPIPARPPDASLDIPTRPDQAVIYRLTGDRNPLHIDPAAAVEAGFPRPILHGLCTFGITCRAVMATYAEYDPARIRSHAARFSAPVFPGETITVDLWKDADVVSFEARVKARDVTVIRNGRSILAPN